MNKTRIRLLVPLLATNMLFLGCVSLYKPTVVQSPLLKEKGEACVTGSIGLLGTGLYNLQGAYAVKEHVGVLAGGMFHTERTDEESGNPETTNQFYGEAGSGYFTTFGKKTGDCFNVTAVSDWVEAIRSNTWMTKRNPG